MKDNITEKLHTQFYKCNKLLKRNVFEQRMEHIKAVPYKGQGKILRLLLENGELSQKDIVIEMDIRPSTVWELVGKLERAGFVEKIPNPDDKRGTIIKLTENGKEEAKSSKWNLNNLSSELYSALTQDEQYQLSGLLEKLILSLKKTENIIESDIELDFDGFDEVQLEKKMHSDFGAKFKKEMKESKKFFKEFFSDLGFKKRNEECNQDSDDKQTMNFEATEESEETDEK